MNKLIYFTRIFILITAFSIAAAFGQTATPGSTPNPTPVPHPNAHQIILRLKSEWAQARQCKKNGTLTQSDEINLFKNLKSVDWEAGNLIRRNGTRELTDAQTAQLNATLDEIQKTLTAAGGQPTERFHH